MSLVLSHTAQIALSSALWLQASKNARERCVPPKFISHSVKRQAPLAWEEAVAHPRRKKMLGFATLAYAAAGFRSCSQAVFGRTMTRRAPPSS